MALGETGKLFGEARDGGDRARSALLEHLRPRLVLWITARMSPGLRARVDPEDLAQETLLGLHRSLDAFEGRGQRAFLAWVFKIAENRIRDCVDREGAQKRQTPEPRAFTQTSPSGRASREEQIIRLRQAMEQLPDDYREVIRLRRLEEREYEDVAEILGRTQNAVRVLYCRALKALRGVLDGAGPR